MKNNDLISQSKRRAIQYWYVDGTFELSFGGLSLLLALYFFALAKLEDTTFGWPLNAGLILVMAVGGFAVNWLVMRLKEKVTFPRTGYIAFKRERGKKRIGALLLLGVISGLAAALLAVALISLSSDAIITLLNAAPRPLSLITGFSGLVFGAALVIVAIRTALPRFYLAALLSLGIGAALMFSGLTMNLALSAYYVLIGIALLIMGAVT
ncbi:MAG: hypothetical protein WHV44_09280, partial [Anaerolineales bacterium]